MAKIMNFDVLAAELDFEVIKMQMSGKRVVLGGGGVASQGDTPDGEQWRILGYGISLTPWIDAW